MQEPHRPVQAVILAAGYGRRMRPLSYDSHKALLPVGGTTILGRIMDGLVYAGISRVTVATGHAAASVEQFLTANYPKLDIRLVHNERYADTNNIVSLSLALDELELDADVLLIECDLLFDPDLLTRLVEHSATNVALVDRYRTGMDGTVVALRDGFVSEVFPTDAQGPDFDYDDKFKTLNIYLFGRDYCRSTLRPMLNTYANVIDSSCYYELVLGMLANIPAHRITAEIVQGDRWVEVDDPNDLAVAEFRFEPAHRTALLDRTFGGHWNLDLLDFAFMRNAYYPTGAMLAALRHALPDLVASYGSAQPVLNEKLSYFLECATEHLQVLHGATQAYPILSRMFADSTVAIPAPTFGEYARSFPQASTYADSPGFDWADIEQKAVDHQLAVLVNPNPPTGSTLPSARIYDLARRTPDTMFLVDESFLAFSGEPSLLSMLETGPLDNVVVLTSLSKCLGTPGLRLGYLYSRNRSFIERIGQALPIWNLSAPTEFVLELLLKFRVAYAESLERTIRDREKLREQLAELPVVDHVHTSGGNFLLTCLKGQNPQRAHELRGQLLAQARIEVKDVSDRFPDRLPRLRLAVRTDTENDRLITALAEVSADL